MKQFCPKCSKWYDVSANVCPICRSQLLVPNNTSQSQNTQETNKNTQYQQIQNPPPIPKEINKKRIAGDIMNVFGIVILLAFICLFYISINYLSAVFTILFFIGALFGLFLFSFGLKFSREYSTYIKKYQETFYSSQIPDNPLIECPYCHSHKVVKISTSNRVGSVLIAGIASSKIGKQWHCHNCNSDF